MDRYEIIEGNSEAYFVENGPIEALDEADVIIHEVPEAAGSFATNAYEASRNSWSPEEEKCLLAAYKEDKHLFDGTSCKNDRAWSIIQQKMENNGFPQKSALQCKNKFNNLKKKYKKVKDNNNKSGAARANFEHQEWFEDTFGRDHDIAPIAYAESSRFTQLASSSTLLVDDPQEEPPNVPKKRRRLHSEQYINLLEDISKANRKYRENRLQDKSQERQDKLRFQQECVAAVNNATEVSRTTMEKLIEKL